MNESFRAKESFRANEFFRVWGVSDRRSLSVPSVSLSGQEPLFSVPSVPLCVLSLCALKTSPRLCVRKTILRESFRPHP